MCNHGNNYQFQFLILKVQKNYYSLNFEQNITNLFKLILLKFRMLINFLNFLFHNMQCKICLHIKLVNLNQVQNIHDYHHLLIIKDAYSQEKNYY